MPPDDPSSPQLPRYQPPVQPARQDFSRPTGDIARSPFQPPGPVSAPLQPPNPVTTPQPPVVPIPVPTAPPQPAETPPPAHPPMPRSRRFKRASRIVTILLFLIVIAGAATLWFLHYEAPNKTLTQALMNSLMIRDVAVQTDVSGVITTTDYDVQDTHNPVTSVNGSVTLNGSTFQLAGYATLQNSYFKYTSLGSGQIAQSNASLINTWVQLRVHGSLQPGINSSLADVADPLTLLSGYQIVGDYSYAQAKSMANSLMQDHVYSYKLSGVKRVTSDKQSYDQYPIMINATAYKHWAQQMANAMGLSSQDTQTLLHTLASRGRTTGMLYVNTKTDQIIRFNLTSDSRTISALYSNYNEVNMPNQPQAAFSWQQFAPSQNKLEQQAALIQSDASLDAERKADIAQLQHYIEAYYTANASYPALSDLNNQVWVSVNMQGINPDVFKDPQGVAEQLSATPAASVYAYEPLSANGSASCTDASQSPAVQNTQPCVSYKLLATLSNGKQYQVVNIN
jgi:hypothetical protein